MPFSRKLAEAVRLFFAAALLGGGLAARALPVTNAWDDAANYYKSANWTNGSNLGFGFAPWVIQTNSYGGGGARGWYLNNGYAIASTTFIGGAAYTNCSWGLYANGTAPAGGNRTVAYRGFTSPLTTNTTFTVQWMAEGIGFANTNYGGFVLRSGNTNSSVATLESGYRFELYYVGGGTNSFLVKDGGGTAVALGVPYAAANGNPVGNHYNATGLNCEFTLQPGDTYRLVLRSATTGEVLAFVDGRPLAGGAGTSIDSVALFANETVSTGANGGDQNFNRLSIVSSDAIAPAIYNVRPADGSYFVNPATNQITFAVASSVADLVASNVSLTLNGVAQPLAFSTVAIASQLLVTNTAPLGTNVQYKAVIIAADTNGHFATNTFEFDTTQTNSLWRDPKTYGAAANGTTKDTTAIQNAINACPAGGTVWLHDGTFFSGMIKLKSNMTLLIDASATLLGTGDVNDYPTQTPPLTNGQTLNCKKALVYAESCTNLVIRGPGTINGNGRNNFTSGLEGTRPIAIWLTVCTNVTLKDFKIVDASMWTCVPMQTDNLLISGIDINDDGLNGNRDGIDPVDCWHVVIEDCTINSGDDSICLKSGNPRGVNDVRVRNCVITKSQSNGLKFGTASVGPFTNIVFSDCVVLNTDHSAMAVESVDGSAIRDVTFERIYVQGCQNAIFIVLGSRSGATIGSVDGITFRDITGTQMSDSRGCPLMGVQTNGITYRLKNLLFDNVNVSYKGGAGTVPGTPAEYVGQYPENTIWGNLPAFGYYIRHATNVVFTNCLTTAETADVRPWYATNDVQSFKIYGTTLSQLPGTNRNVLQWLTGYTLQGSTNVSGPFADVAGANAGFYTNAPSGAQKYYRLRQ